jgi:hypothetical protein
MKSKEDITKLVVALVASLIGVGTGLGAMMLLFKYVPSLGQATGPVPFLVTIGFCGGGLIGGGYVGLWLVTRQHRAKRKQYFEDKKKQRKKRK